jgi:hypothetical protein
MSGWAGPYGPCVLTRLSSPRALAGELTLHLPAGRRPLKPIVLDVALIVRAGHRPARLSAVRGEDSPPDRDYRLGDSYVTASVCTPRSR